MIIILFTQPSKTRNFISVYFVIYEITRLEERIFYFDGFSKATRYPWLRELLISLRFETAFKEACLSTSANGVLMEK